MVNRTALKIGLDRVGMEALADEVGNMSPAAVEQLAKLRSKAYIDVRVPKFLRWLA